VSTTNSESHSPPKRKKGHHGQTAIDLRVDADFYAYRSCQVNEEELDWGEDIITIVSNLDEVIRTFEQDISNLRSQFDTTNVTLYFSDTKNFRKTVDPEYKGNRTKRKPVGYRRLLDWCRQHYDTVTIPNLEADDALGIHCHNDPSHFVLVSPDKDMKQIACRLFNGKEEVTTTKEQADYWFWTQCLTGDPVDGYKGVPGIGAKGAEKLLVGAQGKEWEVIRGAYEKAGLTEDDAIRNARLARILRPDEYNFTTKEPILWTPPSLDSSQS
jgi:5'-3' exonuclease